jgi:prefoldin subunit 5
MAHVAKYTKGALGHMFAHYERARGKDGEYIKFGNESIDTTKSHLNYNLAPNRDMSQGEFVKKRCNEVKCLNRKDVNVMCSWVVTAPKDLDPSQQEDFFKESYKFLEDRYGDDNVVSAYVHLDEATPHMHFSFVPVVYDSKKDILKVNAKQKVSRSDLQSFHKDLQEHLDRANIKCNVLNEATREGNKSIDELKRQSATERLKEVSQKASQIVSEAHDEVQAIKDNLIPLKAEYEAKKAYVMEVDKISQVSMMYPSEVKVTEKGFINKQKFVTVPAEMWEAKHISANEKSYLKKATEKLDKNIKEFNSTTTSNKIESLSKRVMELERENSSLSSENRKLEDKIDKTYNKINNVLNRLPDNVAEQFIKTWEDVAKNHNRNLDIDR